MPIGHGGRLASRASTWPRDHFCRSTIAPRRSCPFQAERVLADIDADHGDCAIGLLRHGVLLVFAAPSHILLLAGLEHGLTIPLPDVVKADRDLWSKKAPARCPCPSHGWAHPIRSKRSKVLVQQRSLSAECQSLRLEHHRKQASSRRS